MVPTYYTVAQLSEMLHKSKDVIRRITARGDFGDTLNDGKSHLVTEQGLQNYIKSHTGPAHYERNLIGNMRRGHSDYRRADCMAKI